MVYSNAMTLKAVDLVVSKGIVSPSFREGLVAGQETDESLLIVSPNLEKNDLTAIAQAVSICGQDFTKFADSIESYLGRQYPRPRTT